MTRVCALAVETEVNSFLFKFLLDSHESQILPQTETLCTLRYQEEDREEARTETQAPMEEETEEGRSRRKAKEVPDYPGCPATSSPGAWPPPTASWESP